MSDADQPLIDVDRLMGIDLFSELDHHDLAQVARWAHEMRAAPGTVLFEQGGLPFELFVIEEGEVEIVRDGEVLGTVGPGEPVGEMSVLRGERRMATVRAITQVTAISLAADDLEEMNAQMPEVVRSLQEITEERAERNAARDR